MAVPGGWISLAPGGIGDIMGQDLPPGTQLTIQKGSYMASTINVKTDTKFQASSTPMSMITDIQCPRLFHPSQAGGYCAAHVCVMCDSLPSIRALAFILIGAYYCWGGEEGGGVKRVAAVLFGMLLRLCWL